MRRWRRRFLIPAFLIVAIAAVGSTRSIWVPWIGRSLVCARDVAPSDLILIENFDPNYLLFERAAALQRGSIASRALVPVQAWRESAIPNYISQGIADLMARHARMAAWETLPIRHQEPISLNAARQILTHLQGEQVRSVLVVTGGFRSQRSSLVYRAVMGTAGIEVRCDPVFGTITPERWTETWHGIQAVTEELLKLQYYRLYVLPFRTGTRDIGARVT